MAAPTTTRAPDKSLPTLASELWQLVVTYVKQETLLPIKGLARFVAWGLAGAVAMSIGLVLLALAVLRVLQTETDGTFDGRWSWAPYGLTVAACLVVAGLAARSIGSPKRQAQKRGTIG